MNVLQFCGVFTTFLLYNIYVIFYYTTNNIDIIAAFFVFVNLLAGIKREKNDKNYKNKKNLFKTMKKRLTNAKKKGIIIECFGDMAQLVERLVRNEEATSSNLVISTRRNLKRTT